MPRTRVLVVEDDDTLRHMYKWALAAAGFKLDEAATGLDALQRLDDDPPDAVVLDIGLPVVSGLVVRDEIAARADMRHVAVVVVTGSDQYFPLVDVDCV